jgi:transcriptional regulator with XRE-family HTH domain
MSVFERMKILVKTEMNATGVKQGFIAERCGFSDSEFSAVLNGYRRARVDDIDKFCKGMHVSPNFIFNWDDGEPVTAIEQVTSGKC